MVRFFARLAVFVLACGFAGAAAAEVRLLAFGDSLTAGSGLPKAEGFVPQMQSWLQAHGADDVILVNSGIPGNTTADGLARIDAALVPGIDGVIVALGANDVLRDVPAPAMRTQLDGILTAIDARGLPVLLAGIPAPPFASRPERAALKATYAELAQAHGAILYRSLLAGLGQGRGIPEIMALFQPDGIHPNARGVAAIVDHMGPQVLALAELARRRAE